MDEDEITISDLLDAAKVAVRYQQYYDDNLQGKEVPVYTYNLYDQLEEAQDNFKQVLDGYIGQVVKSVLAEQKGEK